MRLTLQIFHHDQWHDAATLTLSAPEKGRSGTATLGHDQHYAVAWMEQRLNQWGLT